MRLKEWREIEKLDGGLRQYRVRAISLLRKYLRMSVEMGRLPSLIGREFFRAKVTSYPTHTFEDAIIFVHDMERSLEFLDAKAQVLITRIFFQEYSYDETAKMLRLPRRTFVRALGSAIDSLSDVLIHRGLMERAPVPLSAAQATEQKHPLATQENDTISVGYLMTLCYPKLCQQRKFSKAGLTI